jgi:hypothetical protein
MVAMTTYRGLKFDPADVKPEQISLYDIVRGLFCQARFCGQLKPFYSESVLHEYYSVLSHSMMVSNLLEYHLKQPKLAIYGLLHDAHEAYISDIPTPVKTLLGPEIYKIEENIDRAVYAKFEIPYPTEDQKKIIKQADNLAFLIEDFHLRHAELAKDHTDLIEVYNQYKIVCYTEAQFTTKFWTIKRSDISEFFRKAL